METDKRDEAKRREAGKRCAKALDSAALALRELHRAALACGEHYRADDGRMLLAENCDEFSSWLHNQYDKP